MEDVAIGLLDEKVIVYKTNEDELKEKMRFEANTLGVQDLKFNKNGNCMFRSNEKILQQPA